jgi:hypothetical protein
MIRVIPQLTFHRTRVSLIAEESVSPFAKGSVVKTVTAVTLKRMTRPLRCSINSKGSPAPIINQ